ncbi:alpha/beta hydrolase [Tropicibacter sp. R16_0]|uniref:alpha/beta fold hydrolase n=1 Tax=Tropicibacter sp. R16_0 TaxID=2821102 RepID=UPI001ADAAB82|nr:alpha/beta hydrolase [Tropicibacter sp. R16_0]MBO9453502.1 alpha/beta hydrolase [Tropicibacter sp. R16_0]
MSTDCQPFTQHLRVEDAELTISGLRRDGEKAPILFLHGFGSTKEDYADIARHRAFDGHGVLAYDAPGCGQTECSDPTRINIPMLVTTALEVLDAAGIDRFHLVGHSMGGLTALMLADAHPGRILSFCDIEGNIAPEDCFLSRQIHDYPAENPQAFMDAFIDRASKAPAWSSPLYAASLAHKVRVEAVRGIFTSMVDLSDNGGLMERFLGLPCPKMFMYGDQNNTLSYLPDINAKGVELAEIPECGHFPMYSNPPEMWRRLSDFITRTEAVR